MEASSVKEEEGERKSDEEEEEQHSFARPTYLDDRPVVLRVLFAVVVPAVFGAIAGYFLGQSKTVYIALQVVAAIGAYASGFEHRSGKQGMLRGLVSGAVFGGAILLVHKATGDKETLKLPHPQGILVAFTAVIGAILTGWGALARQTREEHPREPFKLDFSRLGRAELYGFIGAAILFASLWLPWYETSSNPNAHINGRRGTFNAFQTFKILDILLVAACSAPFILAWIIARGHKLTWRPGEVTMIVGMIAFVLIMLNGIILGEPGDPDSEISRQVGWYVGLLGSVAICAAGVFRQASMGRDKKPPGVL